MDGGVVADKRNPLNGDKNNIYGPTPALFPQPEPSFGMKSAILLCFLTWM